jgi:hypothetical protein
MQSRRKEQVVQHEALGIVEVGVSIAELMEVASQSAQKMPQVMSRVAHRLHTEKVCL